MESKAWRRVAVHGVDGLTEVGFAAESNFLVVVSELGRGVFDTVTGDRVSRHEDGETTDWFDEATKRALGIGPLDGEWVAVAGLCGGALPDVTGDGWVVRRDGRGVVLSHPDHASQHIHETEELRAFGFSPRGDCFVLAVTPDVHIYRRVEAAPAG